MTSRLAIVVSVFALVLAACSSGGASPSASALGRFQRRASAPSAAAGELTIYAAASLKGALEKAKAAYEAANPGTTLTLSTDSSSALETQIEQGAPADVFLSADTTNPQEARRQGPRRGCPGHVRRQRADDHRADRQPGRHRVADGPRHARRQGHRRRRRGADHEVRHPARRQPRQGEPATPPTSPRRTPRTSRPRRTTSRPSSPRSNWARATPASSM